MTMPIWHTALNVTKVFSFENIIIIPQEMEKVKGFTKIFVTSLLLLFLKFIWEFYKKILTNEKEYDIIILEIEIAIAIDGSGNRLRYYVYLYLRFLESIDKALTKRNWHLYLLYS